MRIIRSFAGKTTTNFEPNPVKPVRHQTLTIYRLAHKSSFTVITDLIGATKALSIRCLNHVIRQLTAHFRDDYVKIQENADE